MRTLVAFFEIPAKNFGRAVKFYETVLVSNLKKIAYDHEKMAFFPKVEGKYPGAISFSEGFIPSIQGVLISFEVSSIEEALVKVEREGGEILAPKTKIEAADRGYFCLIQDSEGNRVGLYADQ